MRKPCRNWKAAKASYTFKEAAEQLGYSSTGPVYELLSSGALVATEIKGGGRGLRVMGTSLEDHVNRNIIKPDEYLVKAAEMARQNRREDKS